MFNVCIYATTRLLLALTTCVTAKNVKKERKKQCTANIREKHVRHTKDLVLDSDFYWWFMTTTVLHFTTD